MINDVDPYVPKEFRLPQMPDWAKDAVFTNIDTHFGMRDRLRILFGGVLTTRVVTFCEHVPGYADSEVTTHVYFEHAPKTELGVTPRE